EHPGDCPWVSSQPPFSCHPFGNSERRRAARPSWSCSPWVVLLLTASLTTTPDTPGSATESLELPRPPACSAHIPEEVGVGSDRNPFDSADIRTEGAGIRRRGRDGPRDQGVWGSGGSARRRLSTVRAKVVRRTSAPSLARVLAKVPSLRARSSSSLEATPRARRRTASSWACSL